MAVSSYETHTLNNGVAVYAATVNSLTPALLVQYHSLLSSDERRRNARFQRLADRNRDLLARALLRCTLAKYLQQSPKDLVFGRGAHGKPMLEGGDQPLTGAVDGLASPLTLQFNLSHAGDWVVLAVSDALVGIDIESSQRRNDVMAIADRYFYGDEITELRSYPESQQRDRFFDYWTLKEAFMKARGEGIALGLDNFGFRLRDCRRIEIFMQPSLADDPKAWRFHCCTPQPGYRLALAYRSAVRLPISVYGACPLVATEALDWPLNEGPLNE